MAERIPITDLFARWLLRAAAFLLPLAFLPNIVDEFVLPKLLLARVLIAVSVVLLLVRWLRQGTLTWRRTPLDLPLLAFIGSAALSTIFAINRNVAIFGTYDRWEGLLTIVTYGLVYWLTVQLLSGESDARGLTWSLLLSGYLIAAIAILQSAFGLFGGGYFTTGNNVIRPDVTLANPDFLGIFLAMLLPVAFAKLISRRPMTTRVLAANLVIVLFFGLLASFTRAAWIGAVIGVVVVLVLRRGRFHVRPFVISVAVVVVGFAVLAGVAAARPSGGGIGQALMARIASIANLSSGTQNERIATWGDTLPLIASRPILGYGPDTFGLVYPQFQRGNQHFVLWDKPHQDALGVAASQGLIGLLAYIWILVAFVRAFWKGRTLRGAVALFAGWIAYVVAIQFDFSWIPTSLPFWLFAAAAIVTWSPKIEPLRVAQFPRRIAVPVLAAGSIALLALLIPGVLLPYLADADYYASQAAPDLRQARDTIGQARQFAPYEAVYAIVAGNYALNLDQNDNPAADADWAAAREAYDAAARLGSFSPEMFRHLAIVDEHLGDHAGAVAAARRAVELDRYDPESLALLQKLTGQ
ncbi:MAG TPA: O-antigen ligase family protein [Candidatus Nitrosopolaris sp.]|nr:O-antigen ligase family protein [Candidatus Nitrosopolaris sp.]